MKKREILIIIAVIIVGVFIQQNRTGKITLFKGASTKLKSLKDRNHPNIFQEQDEILKNIDRIKINNKAGDIEIEKSLTGTTIITKKVVVYHRKQSVADKIYRKLKITTSKTNNNISIDIEPKVKYFPYKRVRVIFQLKVPAQTKLTIYNKFGNVTIRDLSGEIEINEMYGNVEVEDVNAKLQIYNKYGNLTLKNLKQKCYIETANSTVNIREANSLDLRLKYTKLSLENIKGDTDILKARYSRVKISNANKVKINGKHIKVLLNKIQDHIFLKNTHESIFLEDIHGDIRILSKDCKIVLDKVNTDNIFIKNSINNIRITNSNLAALDIDTSHGGVYIDFQNISDRLVIKSKHSDISIKYPESILPLFNIFSRYGKIKNKTNLVLGVLKDNQNQTLVNSTGKPAIVIKNSYGNITLSNSHQN